MKKGPISDEMLEPMSSKFQMLADTTRLAILQELMAREEMNVTEIVAATRGAVANVSKHLKLLTASGIVSRRKEGAFVLYRLDDPVVEKICDLVCDSMRKQIEEELRQGTASRNQGSKRSGK